jgi:hypothetical protein
MLRIFFILIFISIQLPLASLSFAATDPNKSGDEILKEINDLLEEKAKNKSAESKDVKVDIESLGLDDIDARNPIVLEKKVVTPPLVTVEKKVAPVIVEKKVEEVVKKEVPVAPAVAKIPEKKIPEKKEVIKPAIVATKSNEEVKQENLPKIEPAKIVKEEVKKPLISSEVQVDEAISKIQTFINSAKNNVKNNLGVIVPPSQIEQAKPVQKKESEKGKSLKKVTKNEKKQNERLKKLNKLRRQYLIKFDSKESSQFNNQEDGDFSDDNVKIIPIKREINKFILYETPAPPILDKYRTRDNVNIPIVLGEAEKIEILFKAITDSDDVSYFKSIYNSYRDIGKSNAKNNSGDTILTYAILLQRHSVVASILSLGANPNMPNSLGYTPLGIAIEVGDEVSLKLLLTNGANINYVDAFGRTYLMHAARVGFLPAVDLLISKGVVDVNAMDNDGFTSLAIAYRHKKDVIVKFLLKHGAQTWVEKPYDSSSQSLIKELNDRWKN